MKRHKYSAKIIIRKDYINKSGRAALAVQAFINGQRKIVAIGVGVDPDHFDPARSEVDIPGHQRRTALINALIHKIKARAEDLFLAAILEDQPLTARTFALAIQGSSDPGQDLFSWIRSEIDREKSIRAAGTVSNYRKLIRRLAEFRADMDFGDITEDLIRDFDGWMKSKKKYEPNTRAKYHLTFQKFIRIAIRQKKIRSNPYDHFKIRTAKTERTFLTTDELAELVRLYRSDELTRTKQRSLRAFLFMCFSSLRPGDLAALDQDAVRADGVLIFRPKKTAGDRMILKIPLSQVATDIFADALADQDPGGNGQPFARVREYALRRHIADIGQQFTNIDKHITPYVARHTFATAFLSLGGSVETLREILGHSSLDITSVYIHITKERIAAGMSNFDLFFRVR